MALKMKDIMKSVQLELKPLASAEWAKCPSAQSSQSSVFVWCRFLLEVKACQPKTLSINNPPTSPEVMCALPCNLIVITGRRTLTLFFNNSHGNGSFVVKIQLEGGLTLSSLGECSRGAKLDYVRGEEVCLCEKECVLALEKLK